MRTQHSCTCCMVQLHVCWGTAAAVGLRASIVDASVVFCRPACCFLGLSLCLQLLLHPGLCGAVRGGLHAIPLCFQAAHGSCHCLQENLLCLSMVRRHPVVLAGAPVGYKHLHDLLLGI